MRYKGKKIAVVLFGSLLLSGIQRMTVQAVPEESKAVHIEPAEIETSTLAVGTHLIHLGAMNDAIYKLAKETAQSFNQSEIYYKSELGEDGWYSIGGADSVQVILPEGNRVGDERIEELLFTHHTRSDGVTYDLRTNEAVCLFDIKNPYDRNELAELEELRNQRTLLEKGGTDTGFLKDFFEEEKDIENWDRQGWDRQIHMLHAMYLTAAKGGETERQMLLLKVMERVDSARRLDFNTETLTALNILLDTVTGSEELSGNADLIQAIGAGISNLQVSMDDQESKVFSPDETASAEADSVLTQVENVLMAELLNAVETENDTQWILLDELATLSHIEDGISVDQGAERELLNNRILPLAETLYESTGDEVILQELNYYRGLLDRLDGKNQEVEETTVEEGQTGEDRNTSDGEWIAAFLEKELKGDFGEADARAQNTALLALTKFCEASGEDLPQTPGEGDSQTAAELLEELAAEAAADETSGVFPAGDGEMSGRLEENKATETLLYAPAKKTALWCAMRYVWKQEHRQAVLAKGSRYYQFEAFSDKVVREKKQTDQMENMTGFDSAIYLPGSYLQKEFGVNIRSLGETGYALFVENQIEAEAENLSEKLLALKGQAVP